MPDFTHRSYELERLDTGDYTAAEYKRWQQEMRFIHGIFGEVRALRNTMLSDISASSIEKVSILDVGSGTGNMLHQIKRALGSRTSFLVGVEPDIAGARETASHSISVRGDGLTLPFANGSFDFVYCTLLLHHLSDADAVRLIVEMNRVARRQIYVVDLNRDKRAYNLYRFFGRLFLQPLTRDDGALSILRSFTAEEMMQLARDAQLPHAIVTRSKVNRLVLSGGAS